MSVLQASEVVEKHPDEVLNISMDFGEWLGTGVTMSAPSVSSEMIGGGDTDLTISGVTVSSDTVVMTVAAGTNGNRYRVTVTVTTSDSQTLVGNGMLKVGDG